MTGFEDAWLAVASHRKYGAVSPELKPLLVEGYSSLLSTALNLATLKQGLEHLLTSVVRQGSHECELLGD